LPDPFQSLQGIGDASAQRDVHLAEYTTWKVGGPARFMVRAGSVGDVREVLEVAGDLGLPLLVLGKGSNILVSDHGFDGVVLCLVGGLATVRVDGKLLVAGGGALLDMVATKACDSSLGGLEFMYGIPGTVGGAVMMNAGAYSQWTSEVLVEACTVTPAGGERRHQRFDGKYRQALVPEDEIVTEATFCLVRGSAGSIRDRMNEMRDLRRANQPLGMASAGSVFKNPPGDHAGRLIEHCGLSGRNVGGAVVSEKHANFIVNGGNATAIDIKKLIELVADEVWSRSGIKLEREVRLVGFESG